MAELLFIATTVFVAYVIFVVLGKSNEASQHAKKQEAQKSDAVAPKVAEQAEAGSAASAAVSATAEPVSMQATVKAASKPSRAKSPAAKPTAAAKPAKSKGSVPAPTPAPVATVESLKNPKTGEVAKIPASYTFAKRWIKEALVEEGLLDKIYKNNELSGDVAAKIQAALQQLAAMDKYQ